MGVSSGVDLIALERQRQIEGEGWTPEHDARHKGNQLAAAAVCYAAPHHVRTEIVVFGYGSLVDWLWPFDEAWWKPNPGDRVRELVKAGALIAAEIDRLQAQKKTTP